MLYLGILSKGHEAVHIACVASGDYEFFGRFDNDELFACLVQIELDVSYLLKNHKRALNLLSAQKPVTILEIRSIALQYPPQCVEELEGSALC